ncbi:MAG: Xaa-Pro peptidase family protein [Acidobacteriota bacterium]
MSQPNPDILAARQARVRAALGREGLEGIVLVHLPNIRYLTGFGGSSAIVVLTAARLVLMTDGRYTTEVDQTVKPACAALELVKVDTTYDDTLARVVGALGPVRLGIEGGHLSVSRYNLLTSRLSGGSGSGGAGSPELVPVERLVEAERLLKDEVEVALFREAAAMLDEAAAAVLGDLRAGQRESDVAADVDWCLKRAGFERTSFETIVASGPNAALPHARPGNRDLRAGDLVILDFGGVHGGYCVDMTRTVSVGTPGAEAQRLYDAVAGALSAAVEAVRPGATAGDVDSAARAVLDQAGLGQAFTHGTGHGLGLEVHEEPRIGPVRANAAGVPLATRDEVLAPGLVITVEPGVYVPGLGGVRIEDDVLVTAHGCEVLTRAPRDMLVI